LKSKIFPIPREKLAAIVYILFLLIFAFAYIFGGSSMIYTPIEGYMPTCLANKPISNEAMKDIIADIEWLNEFYRNKSVVEMFDQFEDLNLNMWLQEGNFTLKNSMLILNTTVNSISYFYHNLNANYFGVVELKFKFNGFSSNSYMLDLISLRRTSGYGGGVIYFYNASGANALNYWDSETSIPYQLLQLDENWHTIEIICNATGRTIKVDGYLKLFLDYGHSFGEILLGQSINAVGYGGSFAVDYISVKGILEACLICFFREVGPFWIYLDKDIEIVTYVKSIEKALDFAKNRPYTAIFVLLPTSIYENFALMYSTRTYSIYVWRN